MLPPSLDCPGYNPWDQATRQEGNHWDTLAGLLKATGGKGFYIPVDPQTMRSAVVSCSAFGIRLICAFSKLFFGLERPSHFA